MDKFSMSSSNKLVVKNSVFLSIRMITVMLVSLYTSRVILDALGVEDFGLYNVVGGIVSLFAFMNGAMSNVTQRYLAFELGKGEDRIKKVFSACMLVHIIIALLIFVLSESIGLYLLNNYLTIPEEKLVAANWVYQISVLSSLIMIINTPYNGAIVAYEKMHAFAYISLIDVCFRLGIAFMILNISDNRLVLYAFFIFIAQLVVRLSYTLYCKRSLPSIQFEFFVDRKLIKELSGFMGWTMFNNLSIIACTQGINVLLNIFFNPIVNAARGIAVQVENSVTMFSKNFQMAISPQIIKSYSMNEREVFYERIYTASRLSFYLLLLFAFPILLHVDAILSIWLKEVPDYTSDFIIIIIIISLVNVLSEALLSAVLASGVIKYFQLISGVLYVLILPISAVCFSFDSEPILVYFVYLVISVLVFLFKLFYVKRYLSISIKKYISSVLIRIVVVSLICFVLYDFKASYFVDNVNGNCFLSFIFSTLLIVLIISFVGLTNIERNKLKCLIGRLMHSIVLGRK